MSAQVMISSRAYQSALPPRRRVQCACAPDFGKRPLLESKVLDVTEPAPFSVPSTYTEADILFPPETKHADEWLGSSPLVSVQSTGGTTFAELESTVPLAPTVPDDEAKKEGLGAYLMQSAPVRCVPVFSRACPARVTMSGPVKTDQSSAVQGLYAPAGDQSVHNQVLDLFHGLLPGRRGRAASD